ncbi:MAG: PBP1A family penicillin-binding protein [Deltaproteobacteria bacterium]|nr:PBP1A family penicillin-binding protein [Deltaproteobacteria bacterium]
MRRVLLRSFIVLCGVALLAAGVAWAVYARARVLVVERVEHGPWEVPTRIHPAPLVLKPGSTLPPGPLADVLDGLGYQRVANPVQPGEFGLASAQRAVVVPRPGWPGLEDVPRDAIEFSHVDGKVTELKRRKGMPLTRAVVPGVPLAEIRGPEGESRRPVALKDIPQALQDAVIAVEDRRFREHHGVDPRGVARALLTNVTSDARQGGSTLTQQLAKNMFLTQERTLSRKLKELFFALALEDAYPKDRILELYLNEIYLGQHGSVSICGVGQAALAYFSKEPARLTLDEAALLAGMIRAPNAYAPDRHPEKARTRRDVVLHLMLEQGRINRKQHDAAVAAPVRVRPTVTVQRQAPWAVDDLVDLINEVVPGVELRSAGLHVETTLDGRIQRAAENALRRGLEKVDARAGVPLEGAVVVMQPAHGNVLAMVGGRSYADSQFNRASRGKRQPGSVFKPLVYLGAFHLLGRSLAPTTLLDDEPLTLTLGGKPWSPRNSDRKFHGEITVRDAVEQSLNVPTVRVGVQVGLPRLVEFLGQLGLAGRLDPVPSLVLGAFDMSPLEVAAAYAALADGAYVPPRMLRRVRDAQGRVLMDGASDAVEVATDEEAYLVRDLMRGVLERGTGRAARALGYHHPASGKTGTTTESRDAWFAGMDGQLLAVVWLGADQPVPTGLTGAQAALPIWVDLMNAIRKNDAPPADPVPAGLTAVDICDESRHRATTHCPARHREVYWRGAEPLDACPVHAEPSDRMEALLRSLPRRLQDLFGGITD